MADRSARVHLTNVQGTGATQLLLSLLPALERNGRVRISSMALPDRGSLSAYRPADPSIEVVVYRRKLPNAISRFLECTVFARRFDGAEPLLVLGDMPLRCVGPQTVFVQTPHLTVPAEGSRRRSSFKSVIARWLFRRNAPRAHSYIVQTSIMEHGLARSCPTIADRIHVVAQPVPSWLLSSGIARKGRIQPAGAPLVLAYPAASYPHKNHALLGAIDPRSAGSWQVAELLLTLTADRHPSPEVPWIRCVGPLSPDEMTELYRGIDALLFLSTDESYGFPLIEAMFVGLPIVCPDLPYARTLCGDGAIYFDPHSVLSLEDAVRVLRERLANGYWPDWSRQLAALPPDWDAVAASMLAIATNGSVGDQRRTAPVQP